MFFTLSCAAFSFLSKTLFFHPLVDAVPPGSVSVPAPSSGVAAGVVVGSGAPGVLASGAVGVSVAVGAGAPGVSAPGADGDTPVPEPPPRRMFLILIISSRMLFNMLPCPAVPELFAAPSRASLAASALPGRKPADETPPWVLPDARFLFTKST